MCIRDRCYTVPGTAHIKTFDNLEAIVRFLYQSGCQKESSLLIIGNQQLKELGGFIASAYCCGIAYLDVYKRQMQRFVRMNTGVGERLPAAVLPHAHRLILMQVFLNISSHRQCIRNRLCRK